jgi:hypothetical protein
MNTPSEKNIQEFVANRVIDYLEKSENEHSILRHILKDELLRCVLCKTLVVPVDKRDEQYKDIWICPCDFCFIDENYPTYSSIYLTDFRSRGLSEPICDTIYCKRCVKINGYNNLFCRYDMKERKYIDFNGNDFHDITLDRRRLVFSRGESRYINMCKKCVKENENN